MEHLTRLAADMAALEEQLTRCMRCGLCQAVCPLYDVTGRETDVARGKLALLDGLARDVLRDPRGASARLDRCLLCGSCAANCPSGVSALEIFLRARAILAGFNRLSPLSKLIFRGILARPALFDGLLALAPRLQGLLARPADRELGTWRSVDLGPLRGRHFPGLAAAPFRAQAGSLGRPPREGQPRVALFTGCLIDRVFPRVGLAVARVLEHHGVGLAIPANQACCGMPALAAGQSGAFADLVRHNLERFDPTHFDYLVTACATCTEAIARLWPLMARGLSRAERLRLEDLAGRTRDISQFLAEGGFLGQTPGAAPGGASVTYHDPCHLAKSLGVRAQPRRVLRSAVGADFVEMAEPDWCCGMGGSFNLAHYDLSTEIGRRKAGNIRDSGALVVATSCPACMIQLSDALGRGGGGVEVLHVAEVLARSITA